MVKYGLKIRSALAYTSINPALLISKLLAHQKSANMSERLRNIKIFRSSG